MPGSDCTPAGPTFRPTPNCISSDPSQKVLFAPPPRIFQIYIVTPIWKKFRPKLLGLYYAWWQFVQAKKVSISTGSRDQILAKGRPNSIFLEGLDKVLHPIVLLAHQQAILDITVLLTAAHCGISIINWSHRARTIDFVILCLIKAYQTTLFILLAAESSK